MGVTARNVGSSHVTRQQGASRGCGSADFPEWLPSQACSSAHTQVIPTAPPTSPLLVSSPRLGSWSEPQQGYLLHHHYLCGLRLQLPT